ncbi:SgcJ/EcaC family oxidoreductase [Streptomyces sp. NPDC048643]|uniref:SgcJ/EcaC family oxidoreductase n=1 Tax=Streptomyces sp. NPDC048643 TaxID=3155637 RepID=UPI003445A60E
MTSTEALTVPSAAPEAERAVRGVIGDIYTAWAANDADAFVERYAPDATVLLPGTFRHDREELRTAMAAAFAGPLKGSRALNEVRSVRFPGEGTALVICERSVVLAGEDEPREESRALDSWVLSESDGAWWVRGFHGCPARQV